jgi:hypothetical protein
MFTIAGGIILAVIIFFLLRILAYAGAAIIASMVIVAGILGIPLGIALVVISVIDSPIFQSIFGVLTTIFFVFLGIIGVVLAILFVIGSFLLAKFAYIKINRKKITAKYLLYESQVANLLDNILGKNNENAGILLFGADKNEKNGVSRKIALGVFELTLKCSYKEQKIHCSVNKIGAFDPAFKNFFYSDWEHFRLSDNLFKISFLDFDEILALKRELENFISNLDARLERCKKIKSSGMNFFQDAKRYEQNNRTVMIYEHLMPGADGISTKRPVLSTEPINAKVKFDFENIRVDVTIKGEELITIDGMKWNELRKRRKIKFLGESE